MGFWVFCLIFISTLWSSSMHTGYVNMYIWLITRLISVCAASLEENVICRNAEAGVIVASTPGSPTQSHAVLTRNKISYGQGAGVELTNGTTANLENNEIFKNKSTGIHSPAGLLHRQKGKYLCCSFYLLAWFTWRCWEHNLRSLEGAGRKQLGTTIVQCFLLACIY